MSRLMKTAKQKQRSQLLGFAEIFPSVALEASSREGSD